MPAAGLDFGAIAAGGAGVTQAIEVANASEFPITVRVSGRGGSADVRPLQAGMQFITSKYNPSSYSSKFFASCNLILSCPYLRQGLISFLMPAHRM